MADKTASTKTRDVPFLILACMLAVFLLGMTGDLMRLVVTGSAGPPVASQPTADAPQSPARLRARP